MTFDTEYADRVSLQCVFSNGFLNYHFEQMTYYTYYTYRASLQCVFAGGFLKHYLEQKVFDTEYTDKVSHQCVFSRVVLKHSQLSQGVSDLVSIGYFLASAAHAASVSSCC